MPVSIEEKSTILIDTLCSLFYRNRKTSCELGYERLQRGYKDVIPKESFYYIPSRPDHLNDILNFLYKNREKDRKVIRICDLGCGDGLFLQYLGVYLELLVPQTVVKLHGVEYDKGIAPCGHNIVIERENFFNLTIEYISLFDYIYAYNPLKIPEANIKLLKMITTGMKKGATFIFTNSTVPEESLVKIGFKRMKNTSQIFLFTKE